MDWCRRLITGNVMAKIHQASLSLSLWCEIHGGLKTLIFCEGRKSPSLITCLTVVYLTLSLRRRAWQFQIQRKKRLLNEQTLENILTTRRSKSDTWQFKHDGFLYGFNCSNWFHCTHHTMFVLTNTCLCFKWMVHTEINIKNLSSITSVL